MNAPCTCGECAELDLEFPGEGGQLPLAEDWIAETRRLVVEARAARAARWRTRERETHA